MEEEEGETGGEGVDVEERVRLRVEADLERWEVESRSRWGLEGLCAGLCNAGEEAGWG